MPSARTTGVTLAAAAPVLLAAAAVVLSSCGGGVPAGQGPMDGARAKLHVQKLVELGPRPAGSEALGRAADYLASELEQLGLSAQRQEFTDDEHAPGIRFRNVWTQIDGADPDHGPILAIAAHYDSKVTEGHPDESHNFPFVGAIDGGGASGVLIELARHLVKRDTLPNVWLIWFDGEESLEFHWNDDKALFGSRHFVKAMGADKERFPKGLSARMKCLVLLDLIGDRNMKLDRDLNSHKDLQDLFQEAAAEIGAADRVYADGYKGEFKDDHIPFANVGVRVVDLIDFRYRVPEHLGGRELHPDYTAWWHTEHDTLDKVSANALALAGNLVWAALPKIEQRYYGRE